MKRRITNIPEEVQQFLNDDLFSPGELQTRKRIVNDTMTVKYTDLDQVFSSEDLVLIELDQNNQLYDSDHSDTPQYELVIAKEHDECISVKHIVVESSSESSSISINDAYKTYLLTGEVTKQNVANTDLHNIPIPIFQTAVWDGSVVPVVQLKNGKKALFTNDGFIEGVTIDF